MDDKINFIISDEVITDVSQKLNEVTAALQPYLIAKAVSNSQTQ